MLIGLIRVVLASLMVGVVGSCSLYENHEANSPANVMEVESRLVKAGFRRITIDTPEQHGAVAQLPMHRLNRYRSASGSVFWYADPTICHCLYEGDQTAYQIYAGLLQQEHDTAEYVNDVEPEQVAYLSPFGYAFPPPLLLGGWPVMIPGGGVIYPGGGPIRSVGQPGGGVFSHHGPGGGRGIGGHGHH